MTIGIIGVGYVGLVTGACLADLGHTVHCIDNDKVKIDNINKGILPIYEPQLDNMVKYNITSNKLSFESDYDSISMCDAVIITVGTPPMEDGSANLEYVTSAAREFGKHISKHSVLVVKSTVPVGTSDMLKVVVSEEIKKREVDIEFDMVSNPEFLQEGNAIDNFMNPDRIIIGYSSEYAKVLMKAIYKYFDDDKIVLTSIPSAEITKYASNAMLATRISFINNIAALCDKTGANVKDVAKCMGMDMRIGEKFLNAGCGFGGSCFPKDVLAFVNMGEKYGIDMQISKATYNVNADQKHVLYDKLYSASSKVSYQIKNIAILGLAFKPGTDDMREAPSISLVNDLMNDDLRIGPFDSIRLYDPKAINQAKTIIGETNEKIIYCTTIDSALMDADALIIVTEWPNIKEMPMDVTRRLMRGNIIVDGRNIYKRDIIEKIGFIYEAIGC